MNTIAVDQARCQFGLQQCAIAINIYPLNLSHDLTVQKQQYKAVSPVKSDQFSIDSQNISTNKTLLLKSFKLKTHQSRQIWGFDMTNLYNDNKFSSMYSMLHRAEIWEGSWVLRAYSMSWCVQRVLVCPTTTA